MIWALWPDPCTKGLSGQHIRYADSGREYEQNVTVTIKQYATTTVVRWTITVALSLQRQGIVISRLLKKFYY